jgi:hypothetical protein
MKTRAVLPTILAFLVALTLMTAPAFAQQITGVPGSPDATTTIDGRYLPNTPPVFGGKIGLRAKDSTPYWPPQVVPPKGAPNVLLIMTDDAGYGVAGTFGGVIPTPALDRIANTGLRYTQFHSAALCSPTRAALITGRNHHSVGFRVVAEQTTGYPGYDSVIGVDNATIGEILNQNGYATSWFGKNHNTPSFQYSAAGPFDQWPIGIGFEYFYGFMGGDSSQWRPFLFENTTQVFPWVGKPGYNLITDQTDKAIEHIKKLDASVPDKPFFVYYTPGASHAPHHVPPEWIAKFKGKFDMGWNAMREQIFANQKTLGVIPAHTQLTPWPDDLPKWDTLDADSKKLFARQAEVFAAYVAYSDYEIGRVIQAVEDMGKLDNTFIFYNMARFRMDGSQSMTPGRHTILLDFTSDGPGFGKGGTGSLKVDGKEVANGKIPHTMPFLMPWDETFDVGVDTRTGVDDRDYQVPFRFNGKMNKLTVTLDEPK